MFLATIVYLRSIFTCFPQRILNLLYRIVHFIFLHEPFTSSSVKRVSQEHKVGSCCVSEIEAKTNVIVTFVIYESSNVTQGTMNMI